MAKQSIINRVVPVIQSGPDEASCKLTAQLIADHLKLSDTEALDFYRKCGFDVDSLDPLKGQSCV